jgi:hypothetical protein
MNDTVITGAAIGTVTWFSVWFIASTLTDHSGISLKELAVFVVVGAAIGWLVS